MLKLNRISARGFGGPAVFKNQRTRAGISLRFQGANAQPTVLSPEEIARIPQELMEVAKGFAPKKAEVEAFIQVEQALPETSAFRKIIEADRKNVIGVLYEQVKEITLLQILQGQVTPRQVQALKQFVQAGRETKCDKPGPETIPVICREAELVKPHMKFISKHMYKAGWSVLSSLGVTLDVLVDRGLMKPAMKAVYQTYIDDLDRFDVDFETIFSQMIASYTGKSDPGSSKA